MCVTKVVSSSLVPDIVFKLPVGIGTSMKKKAVMKTLGLGGQEFGWTSSLVVAGAGSNMSCPPSALAHRPLHSPLYHRQLLLCVNTRYTDIHTTHAEHRPKLYELLVVWWKT